MQDLFSNALSSLVSKHIKLSPSRRETLTWLAFLMIQQGTICLWRLAAYVKTDAHTASVRRRFYRFFQFEKLEVGLIARVIIDVLHLPDKPFVLAMDRTNWDFGTTPINILMISVMFKGVGIPLIWTLLPGAGNSHTDARTGLLDQLFKTYPDLKIASLTGDREFIGEAWMRYLDSHKIPFVLRLRENQHVVREGFATLTIAHIARNLQRGKSMILKGSCRLGQHVADTSPRVRLVILRLKTGELLALACSGRPRQALDRYRCRWTIETLFGNLKTKGFNLEDTHITNAEKLSTLLCVLALSVALAVKTGAGMAKLKPIPLKKHGRKAWSVFALGLCTLRKMISTARPDHVIIFLKQLISPKLPTNSLKYIPF